MLTCSSLRMCALLLALSIFGCKENTPPVVNHLGEIKFEATGKAEAQPIFTKGMLLLHSFEYTDAAEAFRSKNHGP